MPVSTGTSLIACKQALVAALAARAGIIAAGASVTYDYPISNITGKDIWLGDADSTNQIKMMRAGTKKVDEDYTLLVVAQVLKTQGQGQLAADLDVLVLLGEIQQLLAETPQLTSEIQWALFAGWSHSIGPFGIDDGGNTSRGSRFEIRVSVRARLA